MTEGSDKLCVFRGIVDGCNDIWTTFSRDFAKTLKQRASNLLVWKGG
jgi:hypothetical protein